MESGECPFHPQGPGSPAGRPQNGGGPRRGQIDRQMAVCAEEIDPIRRGADDERCEDLDVDAVGEGEVQTGGILRGAPRARRTAHRGDGAAPQGGQGFPAVIYL